MIFLPTVYAWDICRPFSYRFVCNHSCNLEIRVVHAVSFYFLLVTFLNIILQIATKVCFVKLYIQLLYCIWYDRKCFEPENVIIFQLWALTIFNSTFVHARVKENQLGSFMLNNNTRAVSKQKIQ